MIFATPISIKRTRLLVRKGDEYVSLHIKDIAFIYRSDTVIFVIDKTERKFFCDKNLSVLEAELDERLFFRANRQYLLNINYVRGFKVFEKVKLEVFLKMAHADHQIIISQKTAPFFKKWISEEE
jgi:DNA-binding LytR/AlgR family response regulator